MSFTATHPSRTDAVTVLCVDDHEVIAEGLGARFRLEGDLELVGHLTTADQLLATVERLRPDVVLLDIDMPGPDPFDAAAEVARLYPESRVVILSAFVRDQYISSAMRAKVRGYLTKSDEPAALVAALRRVMNGDFVVSPRVSERLQASAGARREGAGLKLESLTRRELEVLRLIGKGLSRAEIAETLCRSPKTIDGHRERLMQKLDLHSGPDLVRFAIREGLVEA